MTASAPRPLGLLAELTHRCPLRCPYCSNPLALDRRGVELDTATWQRVFDQARALGVLQVHLSGGEPALRGDLEEIVGRCATVGLYTNLITSGLSLDDERLGELQVRGLDHVQLSLQDACESDGDVIAGFRGAHRRKTAFAETVARRNLPLTINVVVHRRNIGNLPAIIRLAAELGARRLEVAHAQYHGWALANRAMLMPTRAQVDEAETVVVEARRQYAGRLAIDAVTPDYHAEWPKPCMGGWGQRILNVNPAGLVLPCHAAETIPDLEFWSVRDHALEDIWRRSPAFVAFRGTGWMQMPCSVCDRKETCHGGCRCQAFAIAGCAAAADPACRLSPFHEDLQRLAEADAASGDGVYRYRGYIRGGQ